MGITQRVSAAYKAFRTEKNGFGETASLANDFLKNGNRLPGFKSTNLKYREQDKYTGYSYAAINNRANSVARLGIYNLKTDADQDIIDAARQNNEVLTHPYLKKINQSLDFTDYQFWYNISTFLDLRGVYFLYVLRNKSANRTGEVQYFKLLNPYNIVRVRNDKTFEIEGYTETRGGMVRELPPHMIIEIARLNPFSIDEPYAPTDAARDSQHSLKQLAEQLRLTIRRNKDFPGAVMVGDNDLVLDEPQMANFKSRILGQSNREEPIFAAGKGMLDWNDMQVDLRKSMPDVVNELNLNALIAVTGNSRTVFGIEQSGVTRDTADVQKDLMIENHTLPQVQFIVDALNLDYMKNYGKEWEANQYKIYVDSPLGVDREAELKDIEIRKQSMEVYNTMVAAGYSREIAAQYANGEIGLDDIGEPTKPTAKEDDPENNDDPGAGAGGNQANQNAHVHNHDHAIEEGGVVSNQFNEEAQRVLAAQQGQLENSVVNVEEQVVAAIVNHVSKNQFDNKDDVITSKEEQKFIEELQAVIAKYYTIIVPLYAESVMQRRAAEFSVLARFNFNNEVKGEIRFNAQRAAESHINTIIEDILGAAENAYQDAVQRIVDATVPQPGQTEAEIYQAARRKALEGAGQQEIVSAIKQKYSEIARTRATTIARNEANRAFNMSQFEADKQFIKESGFEGQAYKKWVTRSSNPCALCRQKASQAPIPFGEPFNKLGDEISATYEDNGKTRVLKQKINYENIQSGNLHVNCQCRYILIIEN